MKAPGSGLTAVGQWFVDESLYDPQIASALGIMPGAEPIDLAYLARERLFGARLTSGRWYTGRTLTEAQEALAAAIAETQRQRDEGR